MSFLGVLKNLWGCREKPPKIYLLQSNRFGFFFLLLDIVKVNIMELINILNFLDFHTCTHRNILKSIKYQLKRYLEFCQLNVHQN